MQCFPGNASPLARGVVAGAGWVSPLWQEASANHYNTVARAPVRWPSGRLEAILPSAMSLTAPLWIEASRSATIHQVVSRNFVVSEVTEP